MSGTAATAASPAVLVVSAKKDYGRRSVGRPEAVSDVSLRVERATIHGLLGPNGAGKTTTLKMLLGLVRPSGGAFELLGHDAHAQGARARVGFLPEQPYFPTQLTAGEALTLYGRLAGVDRSRLRSDVPRLLARVGLEGREGSLLSRFSRGMLQRLGLAQALLGDPELIILDEPASGLDPVGQRDVRNLMLDLKAGGTTVLLSSHQLSEVEAVCDEVTILNRGRVAARGRIDDLLNVGGQTSVRARGAGGLPACVRASATDVAVDSDTTIFSIPDSVVRRVVDELDDAGWAVVSLQPKRDSLEDYFARLLEESGEPGAFPNILLIEINRSVTSSSDGRFRLSGAVAADAVRRKVVWVVVVFAVLLSFVAPTLPSYGVGVAPAVYREVAIALMFTTALVVTVALAATRVPGEIERRTVYNVLSRDVRRSHYIVATWIGLVMVVGVALLCFTLVAVVVGGVVYREVMVRLFAAAFAVWLETGVIAAVTVLLSTTFGPVTNAVGALAFVFVGHSLAVLYGAGPERSAPWWLPSLEVFNVIAPVAHGSGYGIGYAASMLGVFVASSGLALLGASALIERRDL